MIRPSFLDIESRQNLIELARDGSAAHRLARCENGGTVESPVDRMTSDASATNSVAFLRISAGLVVAQRVSMRTLRPMIQPNRANS